MTGLLHATALFFYVTASALFGAGFAGRQSATRAGILLAAAGAVDHAVALAIYTSTFKELPLVGLAPSASTLAFITVAVVLMSALMSDSRSVSLIVMPIVSLLMVAALAVGIHPTGEAMAFRGPWFALHVVLALIGYAGLTVSAAAGLLYLLQFRELKGKRLGRIFRFFPPLPTLDTLGKRGLLIGFPALTLALLVGWGWSARFRQAWTLEEAQVIWGVITWIVFATMVGVRAPGFAARERRGALLSVIGFLVVVIAYVVLRVSPAARGGFL